jgi:hypothetical protein
MKRALCLFSILFALAVLPALAQQHELLAAIPFDFTVRGKLMPAGDYQVAKVTPSGAWMLKSQAGAGGVIFVAIVEDYGPREQPKLLFRRYGGENFLAQICTGSIAVSVPVSKQEAIIRAHAGRPVHVSLVPRLARK